MEFICSREHFKVMLYLVCFNVEGDLKPAGFPAVIACLLCRTFQQALDSFL